VGTVGAARYHKRGCAKQGFGILPLCDDDPAKGGKSIAGVSLPPLRALPREAKLHTLQLAIVAVPAESAQGVIEKLAAAGIKAVLNFAPGRIKVGKDVRLKNVDLSIELETLSFYLAQGNR